MKQKQEPLKKTKKHDKVKTNKKAHVDDNK